MTSITLRPFFHRGKENVAIEAPNLSALTLAIRKPSGAKWSQTHRTWYVPFTEGAGNQITTALTSFGEVNSNELGQYVAKKQRVEATCVTKPAIVVKEGLPLIKAKPAVLTPVWQLSPPNLDALQRFVEELKLRAYSPSTLSTYRTEFLQLLQLLKTRPVHTLTPDDLRRYMLYITEKQRVSANTAHSRINALKFYFEQVLGREKFFWEIPRPKKPQLLPKLLNEDEIARLFKALGNRKHKALLFTAYSAGLRVSEVVNLKIAHIDSGRMQILLCQAKGKKDRYVGLSPVLLDILRSYFKAEKPRPNLFLFESEQTHTAYPTRTVQKIFTTAKIKAGISKEVGIHSLRHSFATHLLDKGTNIRYIKDLLGHFDIKTTERYLHVSKKSLVNIVSPFDDLWNSGKVEW